MPEAKSFRFVEYDFNAKTNAFTATYEIEFVDRESMRFVEELLFPPEADFAKIDDLVRQELFKGLHLVLGVSYYKLYVPSEFEYPYDLSAQDAVFWNEVYQKGLGEFVFRNGLSFAQLAQFIEADAGEHVGRGDCTDFGTRFLSGMKKHTIGKNVVEKTSKTRWGQQRHQRFLVGIGGGKDSIVMVEKLQELKKDQTAFVLQTGKKSEVITQVIDRAGLDALVVRRSLDAQLFETHSGAYNGHVPISAIIAFVGVTLAYATGYSDVVVGNEFSSNFGNIEHEGVVVNHQWSKSQEFESLFVRYALRNFGKHVRYFSLLRSLYELRIVKEFVKYKEYFPLFTSCNRAFKVHKERSQKLWCGECSKCAFLYLLLAAYLEPKDLIDMFGENLFEKVALQQEFKELLGLGDKKPFDCVGTFEECRAALILADANGHKGTLIMQNYLLAVQDLDENISVFQQLQKAPLLADQYKLAFADTVGILGYGKEGKATEAYLQKNWPEKQVVVFDQSDGPDYLAHACAAADFVIKTPGLPGRLVDVDYGTATRLFFEAVRGKATIVGITGSKGKTTTTALVYALLKAGGYDVELVGNIGRPMLSVLQEVLDAGADLANKVFVAELSSYQLAELRIAPDVAVILNLFPEHMDYHGSLEQYYFDKTNIGRYQAATDVLVTTAEVYQEYGADFAGHYVDYLAGKSVQDWECQLLGQHNQQNIQAAVAVADLLGVDESVQKQVVTEFAGVEHRLEFVGEFKKIRFYNDAISTTPQSTIAALHALPDTETIFLGGTDRGYDFTELRTVLLASKVKNVVLFPDSGATILAGIEDQFTVLRTKSMQEAVAFAYNTTTAGMICLLSTASPSYSVWQNFEEKGGQFKHYVTDMSGDS